MTIDNGLRALIIGLIPLLYWLGGLELWLLFLLTCFAGLLVPATEVGLLVAWFGGPSVLLLDAGTLYADGDNTAATQRA